VTSIDEPRRNPDDSSRSAGSTFDGGDDGRFERRLPTAPDGDVVVTAECAHAELWSGGGIRVESRRCCYPSETWTDQAENDSFGVLLPINGAYRVRTGRVTQFVDRRCGNFRRPGDEVVGSGITRDHASTALYVDVDRFDAVDGDDWPTGERLVDARLDLLHRLLRRELRHDADPGAVEMRAVEVVGATLAIDGPPVRRSPGTSARHRQITAEVLEALHGAGQSFSLIELSRAVGCSPFHLSRIFHQTTGVTLRQYRARARLQAAMDLLEQGDRDLSTIAATCGFADHSHLTRTMIAQLGMTPSRLRELLRAPSR
jgi:AraC-like DNA-binding protein